MPTTTHALCGQPIIRLFKFKWKLAGKKKIGNLYVPEILQERATQIVDAKDVVKSETDLKWENAPELKLPELSIANVKTMTGPAHPLWKDEPVYLFTRKTKLVEGTAQVCVLTKTVMYEGLPTSLKTLEGAVSLPNQDEIVQERIMHAHVWDGIQTKLPRKLDIKRPGYNWPREYGIPYSRKVWNLQHNLINLSNVATGKYGSWKRTNIEKAVSQVFCQKEGDKILFETVSDTTVLADKPLAPVGKKEQTLDETLPDIFPLKYTIDIPKSNIYYDKEVFPISTRFQNRHVHTVHISHNSCFYWHQPQKLTRAIAACFGFAAVQAHQIYGAMVKELPVPITVQGVYMDLNTIGFVVYQLNTLNLDSEEGIKNQVWVDGPHQFFKECNEDSGVVDYEPSIIRKIFTMHANGLAL